MTTYDVVQSRHPDYIEHWDNWELWRDVFIGGDWFRNKYLQQFSTIEEQTDFDLRKSVTYVPGFAAAAIQEINNSIFQRMTDIDRPGGSETYQSATTGERGGVDLLGSSMNYFIGQRVLPELLYMRKVGIYVDMPNRKIETLLDQRTKNVRPYLYVFKAEDILNWSMDESVGENYFNSILLRENYNVMNEHGMPKSRAIRYRYMYVDPDTGKVMVTFQNSEGQGIDGDGNLSDVIYPLNIDRIPFVPMELSRGLLTEVARYQVAHLNLASADMSYAIRSNFPIYTEMRDVRGQNPYAIPPKDGSATPSGTAVDAAEAKERKLRIGGRTGRAYPMGAERPGFIHPSSEPLKASMEKQEQLKSEIKQLVHLSVAQLSPTKQASAQSKKMDNSGLEAGLSYIGLELERGENLVAQYWAMYENNKPAKCFYPQKYEIKSDESRRADADQLKVMIGQTPSLTAQKELSKEMMRVLLSHKVNTVTMRKIEQEIDGAEVIYTDPTTIVAAVEAGYMAKKYASIASNLPKDNVEVANKEHADRLAEISASQAPKSDPAARGNTDASTNPKAGATEKQVATDNTKKGQPTSGVRGKGKAPGG